jgi:hypothetical protein
MLLPALLLLVAPHAGAQGQTAGKSRARRSGKRLRARDVIYTRPGGDWPSIVDGRLPARGRRRPPQFDAEPLSAWLRSDQGAMRRRTHPESICFSFKRRILYD